MEPYEHTQSQILNELLSDDSEIRTKYSKLFQQDVKVFVQDMAQAFTKYRNLEGVVQLDVNKSYVQAMVYAAFSLNIVSLKLFLSGFIVAAGNMMRQVSESIALALLCSGKDIKVLERFIEGKYSSSNAVQDVLRNSKQLGLNNDALKQLKDLQKFYHKYSHPTLSTLATLVSFSGIETYVGASFDENKIDIYRKEVKIRANLTKLFPEFIECVIFNIAKW